MTLFDVYIVVDWSARNKRVLGANSIWIADLASPSASPNLVNCGTRTAAYFELVKRLTAYVRSAKRVLVGFDFPYGYPAGLAAALDIAGSPWTGVWHELTSQITDTNVNANNRFVVAANLNVKLGPGGPFWGNPKLGNEPPDRKPSFPFQTISGPRLAYFRETELRLLAKGKRVQSAWQLWGNGTVGSQALVGIPRVWRLRRESALQQYSRVWPLETGFTSDPTADESPIVIHAEIWPGVIPIAAVSGEVRDETQVGSLAKHFQALDQQGTLGAYFAAPAPTPAITVAAEEGWVLGS